MKRAGHPAPPAKATDALAATEGPDAPDVLPPVAEIPGPAATNGRADDIDEDGDGGGADDIDHAAERRALIDLLIYAWDRAKSPGVWERLAAGLEPLGIQVLRPDGEPFDPSRHEVGGVEPTDDDGLVDTISETEVAGFADRGTVIREPVVVVYRHRRTGRGESPAESTVI